MEVREFWRLIDETYSDTSEVQLEQLQRRLDNLDEEARCGFRACFTGLMRHACDWRLWDASRIAFYGMDVDR